VRLPAPRPVRVGWRLVGAAAVVLVLTAVVAARNNGARNRQDVASHGEQRFTPGIWNDLATLPPQPLVLLPPDPSLFRWENIDNGALKVHSVNPGWLILARTSAPSYRLQAKIQMADWSGAVGLFVGGRPCPEHPGWLQCQSVHLSYWAKGGKFRAQRGDWIAP